VVKEPADIVLRAFKAKGVTVYYLPEAERERWAKQFEPFTEKQLSGAGDVGKRIRKIAADVNKKYPYSERAYCEDSVKKNHVNNYW